MRLFAADHDAHAYTRCFYAAVARLGAEIVPLDYSGSVILRTARKGDWVHFHWPSFAYYAPQRAAVWNWVKLLRFTTILVALRLKGARIAWTAHNLYPHDGGRLLIHRIGRRFLCRVANLVLAHGPSAAIILQNELDLPAPKVATGLMGHWVGYYPNSVTVEAARDELGLTSEDFVLLFIGSLKPYKGIEGLLESFSAHAEPHWRLVIAGRFESPEYRIRLRRQCTSDPRVAIHEGYIPDDRLAVFLNAADRVVLPYVEILTSGAAMLAMSFGRPVIAPDRGALRDHVPPIAGDLYDPSMPDGLGQALKAAPAQRYNEADILAHVSTMAWEALAATFVSRMRA